MRSNFLKILTASIFFFSIHSLKAQGIFTGIDGTTIHIPCSPGCTDLHFQVPHLKSDEDYQVVDIPYTPYPYTTPGGNELTALYADDLYSQAITLPFPICFYGAVYTQVVVGSNGLLTFDITNANCANAYTVINQIPFGGSPQCSQGALYYPKAAIMGIFSDLDPTPGQSPGDRKIEWRMEGTAPFRRFIASWYKVGVYGNSACGLVKPTTFQIVVNESTSSIEIFIEQKLCSDFSEGNAILGAQDWTRTKAAWAPNKNSGIWTSRNEGYRLIPSGATSRFVKAEVFRMDGTTLVATATATTPVTGLVDIDFSNVCITGPSEQLIVRTTYSSCIDPTQFIVINDVITIEKDPADFAPTITTHTTACAGSNSGSVDIAPTLGAGPFSFLVNPGGLTQTGTTTTFNGLAPGSYTVTITDVPAGCVSQPIPFTIVDGAGLTTTVNKTDILCNGAANGTITVTQPTIGSPPFQYSLDGVTWQASNTFTGLAAGPYTVYYKESTGCQGSQNISIAEPPVLSATAATVAALCNSQSNGTITVTTNGGVAPYEYSIDGGANWQTSNIFNVAAGPYTITIRDANGCTTTQTVTVTEPAVLTAFSANGPASCGGGNDGVITVTANGGNSGYQYSLDATNFQSSNVFNVAPGNYTVTVKDNLGCTTSFPTTVVLNNDLTFTPQTDPTICEGTSTQLSLTSNAKQYSWTPATGLSSTSIYNPVANPTTTTTYTVTATLGRCSADDIVTVNVNAAPIPDAGTGGAICYGQTYQLHASGGNTYSWSPTSYLDDPLSANPVSKPLKDITYSLSIVTDVNGCASLTTDQVSIDVTPPIKVKTFPYDTVGYAGDQFKILAVASDPDVINYTWTPAIGLNDATIANPLVTAGAIGDVTQYQVTASTAAGCTGLGYVTVRVYKGPDIYVPTGFTPNGDGKNDKFTPFPVGMQRYTYFKVFNRWGLEMFSTTTLNDGWDGKLGGRDQPTGVYVWMIQGVTKDGRTITKKGTVTLIR